MAEFERIVGYRVDREISRSSIASVYQGYQESLQREVLIKRLHPQFVSDPEIRARFEREAHALARIKHKNIVHIYDYRADRELMLLVQEWIGGGSVAEFMRSHGPLEEREAIALAMDVLEGLDVAHRAKVIHRDIKPSNLMLAQGGSIKITDFGLAHFEGSPTLTQQGAIMGTPAYMAPEMVNGQPGTARCDLYSFGVTLYEVLTGENPFQSEHISQTLQRVLTVKPPKLEGVHEETNRLLHLLMAKDPGQRPRSARAVLELLKPLARELDVERGWEAIQVAPQPQLQGDGDLAPLEARSTTTHTIRPVRRPSPPVTVVNLAIGLMFLVVIAVFVFTSRRGAPGTQTTHENGADSSLASRVMPAPDSVADGALPLVLNYGRQQPVSGESRPEQAPADETSRPILRDNSATREISDESDRIPSETENPPGSESRSRDGFALLHGGVLDSIPSAKPVLRSDSGYVMITVQPWAHIYYNDRKVGTTPLSHPLHLPAGNIRVALIHPQFPRVLQEIPVTRAGDTTYFNVDLYEQVVMIEFIDAVPWAKVSLDGRDIGNTPIGNPILLPPGDHVLVFHHPALKSKEIRFTGLAGEKRNFHVNLYD